MGMYWYYFVKEKRVDSPHYLYFCYDTSRSTVQAETMESAKYIADYNIERKGDTIIVEVFTTTICNIFYRKKMIGFDIDVKGAQFIRFGKATYPIDKLNTCSKIDAHPLLVPRSSE